MSMYLLQFFIIYALSETTFGKPNIILLVADDLGFNDVGVHGSTQIPTPNLNALAQNGVLLNNYYVCPVCSPSRGALMTGLYPIHTGTQHDVIFVDQPWGLPLTHTLLPQHLRKLGYATHAVGKWHLGFFRKEYTPVYRGFDSHYGYWGGKEDYYDHTQQMDLIHLGQDKGLAYCNVLPSVLSVVISVSAPQRHSVFLGLFVSGCSCVLSGLHLLGSHADSFPSQMMHFLHPCLEFLDILLRHQRCIWWPAEQKICRQTKITSKEHLRWGITCSLMNGTPVGKQEKGSFLSQSC
ncbi:arylsulfatase B [Trichonephila clavipes]|nr:arylsulfatase B [Trichonephila clavipes]